MPLADDFAGPLRHGERPEGAWPSRYFLDCHVATLLAMTRKTPQNDLKAVQSLFSKNIYLAQVLVKQGRLKSVSEPRRRIWIFKYFGLCFLN